MTSEDQIYDVLVLGSGASGLTAALTAATLGKKVLVAEKSALFGGSTALSGGWVWIPCHPDSLKTNSTDTLQKAADYIRAEAGNLFNAEKAVSYLKNGPKMVAFLREKTRVRFIPDDTFADYHPELDGASDGGRSLVAAPYEGSKLGKHFAQLRPPLKVQTFMGMSIGSGAHLKHFLNATRSPRSALFVAKAFLQYGLDLLRYGRSNRLYNGNALIARLMRSALDNGVDLWLSSPAIELLRDGERVTGAVLMRDGQRVEVKARRGVILATGGIAHDKEQRKKYFPVVQAISVAPMEAAGDGSRMAVSVGGRMDEEVVATAYSAIVSRLRNADGTESLFPHFIDRGKPGVIAVTTDGRRFCNESDSYHDVAQAMIRIGVDGDKIRAFFIAEHRSIRRYGLGAVRPAPLSMKPYIASGYLKTGKTIEDLAAKIGVNAQELAATVRDFNMDAITGIDRKFKRGSNSYNRFQGDYLHKPNPSLAPLSAGPFYAVEVHPGDIGCFLGVKTDANSQVLNGAQPIPGLYAVGNDSASVFSGACIGGGVTIGPAMVFGFVAANHMLGNIVPAFEDPSRPRKLASSEASN